MANPQRIPSAGRWRNRKPRPLGERLWEKVDTSDRDGCWVWLASLSGSGYGQLTDDTGRTRQAHRLAYELVVGPIPDRSVLDHLCRNKRCVNPAHLEPVTLRENLVRGPHMLVSSKTHCKRGHALTPENLRPGLPNRKCRLCFNLRARMYRRGERASRPGEGYWQRQGLG